MRTPVSPPLAFVLFAALLASGFLAVSFRSARDPRPLSHTSTVSPSDPARVSSARKALETEAARDRAAVRSSGGVPPKNEFANTPLDAPDRLEARARSPLWSRSEQDALSFEFVRSSLASALASHLPSHALSATDLDLLAAATMRMRTAQHALREIPKDRGHAEDRDAVRRALEDAILEFSDVLGMTPDEFSRVAQPETGIDPWTLGEEVDAIMIRPIEDAQARP